MNISSKYKVKSILKNETYEWFLNKHYAKRIPNIIYCFGLYNIHKTLQGVISFGSPPSNSLVIGAFNGKYTDIFLELNRLCINDNLEKNVLSFFVSQALKLIEKPKVVVSYADTSQGHNGYIYQATNWIYTGLTEKRTEWRMYNSNKHSKTICEQYTLDERKNDTEKFYTTDRYGFNNQDDDWDKEVYITLIGDSFIHGGYLNFENNFVGTLKKISNKFTRTLFNRLVKEQGVTISNQEEADVEARKSFVTKQKVKWKRRCAPYRCCCRLLWYTLFFPISWPMACCKCCYRKCCKSKHPRIEGL